MAEALESLIKFVYSEWKKDNYKIIDFCHPDIEILLNFIDDASFSEELKSHIINCDICSESLAVGLSIESEQVSPGAELLKWAKDLKAKKKINIFSAFIDQLKTLFVLKIRPEFN